MSVSLLPEYIAGYMDGDGCFRISKYHPKKGGTRYSACVDLTSHIRTLPDAMVEQFSGFVQTKVPRKSNHRLEYRWNKSLSRSSSFLLAVMPHLILKQSQAGLLSELIGRQAPTSIGVPDAELDIRESLREEVKRLNNKSCCPHDSQTPSLAYLSGFFDAEGSVQVSPVWGKQDQLRLYISAGNRCRWVLEQFKAEFGGSVCVHSQAGKYWFWQAVARDAQSTLRAMMPWLIVKKENAINGLSLCDVVVRGRRRPWTGEERAVLNRIREKSVLLNRGERVVISTIATTPPVEVPTLSAV